MMSVVVVVITIFHQLLHQLVCQDPLGWPTPKQNLSKPNKVFKVKYIDLKCQTI